LTVFKEDQSPAPLDRAGDAPDSTPDPSLEDLRQILLRNQTERIAELEIDLDRLEHQVSDTGALVKMIAPVLGDAIRLKIHEARDEMIEALYPIIGQVVQRAVIEAISDLARSLDAQARRSFDVRLIWWRMRARFGGASEAQLRLRELLPSAVADILLIHRETGLLIAHLPGETSQTADTDLFSGMLTAIRDFAQDTLGSAEPAGLGEITYGDQSILIETARHSYLAVIIDGIAPPEFRAEMREILFEIERAHGQELRSFQGEAQSLASVNDTLAPLMADTSPQKLSRAQKRFLAGALGAFSILLFGCCLLTNWAWQLGRRNPLPLAAIAQPSATLTIQLAPTGPPSPTASPTRTTTPTPSPTATRTLLPSPTQTATPAPIFGVLLGNVRMHIEPSPDAAHTGVFLTLGERVELLAMEGEWVQIRQPAAGPEQAAGWIPARWLGLTTSIPARLITPSATP
jgi:hypothetical protein